MNVESYRRLVDSINYGKKLPGAVYLFRPERGTVPARFWQLVCSAEAAAQPEALSGKPGIGVMQMPDARVVGILREITL